MKIIPGAITTNPLAFKDNYISLDYVRVITICRFYTYTAPPFDKYLYIISTNIENKNGRYYNWWFRICF